MRSLLFIIIVSLMPSTLAYQSNSVNELKAGDKAPAFETSTLKGTQLRLSNLKGKVVLLDFMASWCGYCIAEMPELKNLHREFAGANFEIISISLDGGENTDTTIRDLNKLVTTHNINWPIGYDNTGWDNAIARNYNVTSLPAYFIIDRDGVIKMISVGKEKNSIQKLRSIIKKIIRQ